MIGLTFLAIGLLWLALSVFMAINLPKWFGASKPVWRGLLGGVTFVILMVGPFVDHIVGMRQFERLCERARESVWVSPEIVNVIRAGTRSGPYKEIDGTLLKIMLVRDEYFDLDTGQAFLAYETYITDGGRLWGITGLGSKTYCGGSSTLRFRNVWEMHNVQQLLDQGYKK